MKQIVGLLLSCDRTTTTGNREARTPVVVESLEEKTAGLGATILSTGT